MLFRSQIYIYGTLDKNGKTQNFSSLGLEEGDIVTVEGPRTTYGTKIELVDVTVIKIVKSLVKVESIDPEDATISLEGGDATVYLSCKGNGVTVEIPEEAKDWLSISNITGGSNPTVTFHANANNGGARSAVVTFKTSNGSQESAVTATIYQDGSIVDVNCTEFLEAPEGETQYRITAVIQKVDNPAYGNVYLRDWTNKLVYVYGIGAKGDFQTLGLKEGDIVTLVGKRSSHNGNPQMKEAQYEKHFSVTDVTIAEFLAMPDDPDPDHPSVYYRINGMINDIVNPTYGNLYMNDATGNLYVYGCYPGWGAVGNNRKGWLATANIELEDELTMIGYKYTYTDKNTGVSTIELCGGIYFSHTKSE